jgi:hypothetical protein
VALNVSYNFLKGEVPRTLRRFPTSAFGHNLGFCGEAVHTACPERPAAASSTTARSSNENPVVKPGNNGSGRAERIPVQFRLATWSVVVIALIAALVPFAAVLIFLYYTRNSRRVVRLGAAGDTSLADKSLPPPLRHSRVLTETAVCFW